MKYFLLLLFIHLFLPFGHAQFKYNKNTSKLFSVGYQNIIAIDSNRIYKPLTERGNKLYYRPVEIDLWYPASISDSSPTIKYGEILNLLEQRSDRFQDDSAYKGLTTELVQYLCINLKISDTTKLTQLKTISYRNAAPVQGRFPLILYMCAFNGMSYENVSLFEWMASHGYVVASISSVGRYPGNMSTNLADLAEQVFDGLFTINRLKNNSNINSEEIGEIGYSWGGLSALALAMKSGDIKAVLSFDGSEMHYYGESKKEDVEFDQLRNSSFFQEKKINVPYAYLGSGHKETDREVDSIYNIIPLVHQQKYYIHFIKATHEDFSWLPSLSARITERKVLNSDLYQEFNLLSLNYFDQYLKNQNNDFSSKLPLIYQRNISDSVNPAFAIPIKKNEFSIRGRVIDFKNKAPLPYVNIGVVGKNVGTVTRPDGSFLINFNAGSLPDSLTISMVGYQSTTSSIGALLKQTKPVTIELKERISELKEIVFSTKALPTRIKGNTTRSKFLSIGLPLKFLGSETGIKIRLGKNPVLLKSFSFNISENRLDTAVFRMNIYNFKNGVPFENILVQNIILPISKQAGLYTISLTNYKLTMKDDILISLEWVEGSSSGMEMGAIFLSAGFLNSATWHRLTSQAAWKKAIGIGVGFNLLVQNLTQ